MITKKFFKLFPPPKFLNIPYAGLDICDDAVRCIEYSRTSRGFVIHRYGTKPLSPGVIESGSIKDEAALTKAVSELVHELKISAVKASLPEERMYLFKTEVPDASDHEIRQNIEFKLEENVPVSPAEAIFFFSLLPPSATAGKRIASVSVAPQTLVSSYLAVLKSAGLTVLSFEIQAKALARALVLHDSKETQMLVHIMDYKTGIYIDYGGVVCFTSTISWGAQMLSSQPDPVLAISALQKEIGRVHAYWTEHGEGTSISRIIISGHAALSDGLVSHCSPDPKIPVEIGRVWQNAFSENEYIPEIPFDDSLDYAVAAGLALP